MGLAASKWKVEKTPLLGSLGIYAVPAWRHERPIIDSDPGYRENWAEKGKGCFRNTSPETHYAKRTEREDVQ